MTSVDTIPAVVINTPSPKSNNKDYNIIIITPLRSITVVSQAGAHSWVSAHACTLFQRVYHGSSFYSKCMEVVSQISLGPMHAGQTCEIIYLNTLGAYLEHYGIFTAWSNVPARTVSITGGVLRVRGTDPSRKIATHTTSVPLYCNLAGMVSVNTSMPL